MSVVPPTPVTIGRVTGEHTNGPKGELPMTRILWISLRILLIFGFVAIAFGTVVPSGTHATPYFSTLSSLAVSTAEACPCNLKTCSGNVCIPVEEAIGCCVALGVCKSRSCV